MLNSSLDSLPLDLTIEILLLLPFESILACKLVSKPLANLINAPKFYNLYHNRCVAFFAGGNGLYCLLTRHGAGKIAAGEFPPYRVHRIPIGLTKRSSKLNFTDFDLLSGSSNRIVCLKTPRTDFLFFNLFTGARYTVEGALKSIEPEPRRPICSGFGYDRYADDYIIFVVYDTNPSDDGTVRIQFQKPPGMLYFWVYSFRNRGWESVSGYPHASYERPCWRAACSFNRILHWVVATRDEVAENRRLLVLTFDLHTRVFGEITLPRGGNKTAGGYFIGKVSEVDGRLCYVYRARGEWYSKVWVMEEYGVEESWTTLLPSQ